MSKHSEELPYRREVLVAVLVYHYRKDHTACGCGWGRLGHSHPEHVADVYEMAVQGIPTEVPMCAGRVAVAHRRTPMVDGVCPVCGEVS
jgi:hypothetical protein